jgi:hypothetical protein
MDDLEVTPLRETSMAMDLYVNTIFKGHIDEHPARSSYFDDF